MALRVRAFIQNLFDGKGDLSRLALGGAWVFAIGSLLSLLWLVNDGAAEGGKVFATTVGGQEYTIPLLTYRGGIGMLLIWAEILAVAGAFILTAAPRVPRKLSRIGHGVLIAWSALWTLGTWRLAVIDPGFWTLQALFVSALAGCTGWRAWRNWSPPTAPQVAAASTNEAGDAAANYFSDAPPSPKEPLISDSTRKQINEALERARVAAIAASRKVVVGVKAGVAAARDHHAKT